nr:MAG TPA: hypothetical protein [Caudoviricetes sp.]
MTEIKITAKGFTSAVAYKIPPITAETPKAAVIMSV